MPGWRRLKWDWVQFWLDNWSMRGTQLREQAEARRAARIAAEEEGAAPVQKRRRVTFADLVTSTELEPTEAERDRSRRGYGLDARSDSSLVVSWLAGRAVCRDPEMRALVGLVLRDGLRPALR